MHGSQPVQVWQVPDGSSLKKPLFQRDVAGFEAVVAAAIAGRRILKWQHGRDRQFCASHTQIFSFY